MYLEQAEVLNFRGIRHLKIDFESDSTVLIGENSWGKTSLLRALWMMLGRGETLCSFEEKDLYVPVPLLGESEKAESSDTPDAGKVSAGREEALTDNTLLKRPPISFDKKNRHLLHLDYSRRKRNLDRLKNAFEKDATLKTQYEFKLDDVYRNKADKIEISLWFKESEALDPVLGDERLKKYWNYDEDGCYRLRWRVSSFYRDGEFVTEHHLLNRYGTPYDDVPQSIFKLLIRLNPVLRVRDRRMLSTNRERVQNSGNSENDRLYVLMQGLDSGVAATGEAVRESIMLLDTLLKKYLSYYNSPVQIRDGSLKSRNIGDIVNRPISLESMTSLHETMVSPGFNKTKLLAAILAGVVSISENGEQPDANAHPIMIFEDIESRFHPSLLLSFWSIIEMTNMQKIITTNSGDLLSAMPLTSVRRLYREYYDTFSYKIEDGALNRDDLRRIAFHVRINRPMSLFARSWLLVEGETEIWILSQAATILGFSLQCDGIRPVEFAQCGLTPLIKFAKALGIGFFVVTDGDEAGEKYSNVVRGFVDPDHLTEHLLVLPHLDIEHYLYHNGYAQIYKNATGIQGQVRKGTSVDKIIDLAIRKRTKPGMALAVIEEMKKRGPAGVPALFVSMFEEMRRQICEHEIA